MIDGENKRKHKRAHIRLKVEYRGKKFWQMVEARDLSLGGMFIVTDKVEPAQTKIEIMFELGKENKKTVQAQGVVAWNRPQPIKNENGEEVQPAGMGIMFTKITPAISKDFINDIIKSSGG